MLVPYLDNSRGLSQHTGWACAARKRRPSMQVSVTQCRSSSLDALLGLEVCCLEHVLVYGLLPGSTTTKRHHNEKEFRRSPCAQAFSSPARVPKSGEGNLEQPPGSFTNARQSWGTSHLEQFTWLANVLSSFLSATEPIQHTICRRAVPLS